MKKLLLAIMLIAWSAEAVAVEYVVKEEKDNSFGNIRSRITLEIEVPNAVTEHNELQAMMQAAVDRHRKDWPDVISVRLWDSYEDDWAIKNSIDYAPDGCGWTGDPCSQPLWTDLFKGKIPEDLLAYGQSTDEEQDTAEELRCRQDLQCWGDKHAFKATLVCEPMIEQRALHGYEWTDGWFGAKLERFRWNDREAGTLSYTGDEVKFQNGLGAWRQMTYWCHYDPSTEDAEIMVLAKQ